MGKNNISRRILDWPGFPLFSLAAIISLFFIESFFTNKIFLPYGREWEVIYQWHPYLTFFQSSWHDLKFPLWSQNLFAGFPLAAFPHAGAFYPFNLLYLFLDFARGFPMLVMVHLSCGSMLMFGLLREYNNSRPVSWLCALSFGLSGSFMHIAGYLQMFDTLTWLPGIFWFSLRLARRARYHDFLLLTAFSSLGYLAGCVETILYAWTILYLFLFLTERLLLRRLVLPGLALALSVLICCAQFLISSNYLHNSFRAGSEFNIYSTQWLQLLGIFAPLFPGAPGSGQINSGYVGMLLPLGLIAGFRVKNQKKLKSAAVIIALIVLIFLINLWPLSHIFNAIPVFKFGRVAMRWRIFFPFLMVLWIVAAGGLDALTGETDRKTRRMIFWFVVVFILFQLIWAGADFSKSRQFTLTGVSRLVFFISVLGLGALLYKSKETAFKLKPWMAALLLGCDLFALSFLSMPRTDKTVLDPLDDSKIPGALIPSRMHLISSVPWDLDLWRMLRLDRGEGVIFACIRNGIARHQQVLNKIMPYDFNPTVLNSVRAETLPLLNFLSIRHLLVNNAGIPLTDLQSISPDRPFHLVSSGAFQYHENTACLDLYGLYYSALAVADKEALDMLFIPARFEPARRLFIPPKDIDPVIASQPERVRRPGEVQILEYSDQEVQLEVANDAPAYLSIAQAWYPGWRVWVDGREEKLIRADYAYQAVIIKQPGRHRIILKFLPREFGIGLWVSLVSTMILALLSVTAVIRLSNSGSRQETKPQTV